MNKYKVGDKVRVLLGRDKGREGSILKIYPDSLTAIVEDINMYKKHIKKSVTKDGNGGIFDLPRAIQLSKLAIIDDKKKIVKVGFRLEGDKKVRINKKTGKVIDTIK